MTRAMLVAAAFVIGCAPAEEAATDSAAMAVGAAALTAEHIAGTWSGVAMAEGTDSVLFRFTAVTPNGTEGMSIIEGQTDSVHVIHTFDGDSLIATSAPYIDQTLPNKPQVTFRAVGRMEGGKLVGTSAVMVASQPDSVLGRVRFEMTKSP